jgi:predicted alpha/beta-hydrolase family hydrolase
MKQPETYQVKLTQPQAVETTTMLRWSPARTPVRDATLVLGHGAGSGREERTLVALAAGLADRGVAVATFDFAYRAAGRRPPDRMDRLRRAFLDVAAAAVARGAATRVVLGGRSMGGRVASLLAADGHGDGVVALGYPLCPGGRRPPDPRRTAHWPGIRVPVLFVHGDRDRLCPVDELDAARRGHLRDTAHHAHVVAGADHGLATRKRDGRSVAEVDAELVDAVDGWLRRTWGG